MDENLGIKKGCIALAVVNIAVFLYQSVTGTAGNAEYLASHGAVFFPYMESREAWYPLFTAMYLHFDFEHLANNMVMLLAVGRYVEKDMGTVRFLIVYTVSGLLGNILSLGFDIYAGEYAVSAGASGAVFGLVGALLAMAVKNKGSIEGLGIKQILLMIVLSLVSGLTSAGVDNVAHAGGLVTGFLIGLILFRRNLREE